MALPREKRYTFGDILNGDESERVELIDGELYMMAPPTRAHQRALGELFNQLKNHLKDKPCQVYPAPFGVRLFETAGDRPEDSDTMVEPDVSVICDPDKLDELGCRGAPDFIAEVLSPSTQGYDRVKKYDLYLRAGVREYWIVDTKSRTVSVHVLEDGQYGSPQVYVAGDAVPVAALGGLVIDTGELFEPV